MKNKKLKTLVASLALVGAIAVGATLAYFTDNETATNVITMGNVDIDLDEPEFDEDNPDKTITDVTPNQTIVKDPTITLGEGSEDAYVRAKIEYRFDGTPMSDEMSAQLEAGMNIVSSLWVKSGDYYYCQAPLRDVEGENTVQLFTTVTIPASWGNEVANKTIEIIVSAEAIQADNYEPERNELNEIVGWTDADGTPVDLSGNN